MPVYQKGWTSREVWIVTWVYPHTFDREPANAVFSSRIKAFRFAASLVTKKIDHLIDMRIIDNYDEESQTKIWQIRNDLESGIYVPSIHYWNIYFGHREEGEVSVQKYKVDEETLI